MSEHGIGLPKIDDRYETVKVIGDGGMGTVYLARHIHVGKTVAVKVMSLEATEHPGMFERFQNEAQAAALIAHPNIVECYDVGNTKEDGLPYLVFEYLEGSDLLEEMSGTGPMPVRRVLRIAKQVASALASAHAKGVVHRDLKPENIFLTFRDDNPDHVKVLDFGISKFGRTRNPTPSKPISAGTPLYMAPEQFADADAIDGRADVYAFGVLIYRMLAGRTPLAHVPVAELPQKIWTETPPSLRSARHDVPRPLADLVERCLRPNVDIRPSMEEVFSELTDLANSGVATPLPSEAVATVTRLPSDLPTPMAGEVRPSEISLKRPSRLRTPLVGLAAGLVIGAAIYAFVASRGRETVASPAPTPAVEPAPPAVATPELSETIAIAIVSTAQGAKVTYRGETLDLPIAIEIDRGNHPELIEVTAPTFQGRRYWVTFDKPRRLVAKLKPGKGVIDATPDETKIALGEMADPAPERVVVAEPTDPPVFRATKKAAPRPAAAAPMAAATPPPAVPAPEIKPSPPPAAAPIAASTTGTSVLGSVNNTVQAPPAPAPAITAPPPAAKPTVPQAHAPPPAKPVMVPAAKIEGARLQGTRQILLPKVTEQAILAQGLKETGAVVRLCLSTGGQPTSVDVTRGTGFSEADAKIASEMRGWRYRPYVVDGKAVPVCTSIAFRYRVN